jgi:hypothetical protein
VHILTQQARLPGEQQQLAKRMLELGESVRVVVQETQQGFRCSVYLLSWYKSTSTDAAGPSQAFSHAISCAHIYIPVPKY